MSLERAVHVLPRRVAAEHEVVQAGEQAQRQVPRQVGCDVVDERLAGELQAELVVQRRAAGAVRRLPREELRLPVGCGYLASAAFACSAISPNFDGSLTARSASTFRSSSTFAAFRPAMNWL